MQADLDRKAEQERQAAIKAAEKLKTPELREERLAQAEMIVAPVVVAAVAKPVASKLATVTTYTFEVVDAGKIPPEYMIPDAVKIGAVVRATRGSIVIPGVKVIVNKSVR
jgi:hypothetical protein